jgi:ATP-dependent exoDNAse (exonuclease V) alpha subunit
MTKPTLNTGQQEVFKLLNAFLESDVHDTFILNGYAGTGKTFLMQYMGTHLLKEKISFKLLASTGRAAAILRGKTKMEARTVHGQLYFFHKLGGVADTDTHETPNQGFGQMKLLFEFIIPPEDAKVKVLIFDEASMLASEDQGETSHAIFGSGKLMDDIFSATVGTKLIFVGDPAQLPPVGQLNSPALDKQWLESRGRKVTQSTLTQIERTQDGNDILDVALKVRTMLEEVKPNMWNKIPCRNRKNLRVFEDEKTLIDDYITKYQNNGANYTILITNSNNLVQQTNSYIRDCLYGKTNSKMRVGDVLLVTQNNYLVPLTNGDFVKVVAIGLSKTKANLLFTNVRLLSLSTFTEHEILLAADVLESSKNNFTTDQTQELMIDFVRRMSLSRISPNSELFKKNMKTDVYLNCLKAVYGYAITCHKAQGGEWEEVYVLGRKAMLPAPRHIANLRWWYTAITRAKSQLNTNAGYWIK